MFVVKLPTLLLTCRAWRRALEQWKNRSDVFSADRLIMLYSEINGFLLRFWFWVVNNVDIAIDQFHSRVSLFDITYTCILVIVVIVSYRNLLSYSNPQKCSFLWLRRLCRLFTIVCGYFLNCKKHTYDSPFFYVGVCITISSRGLLRYFYF